MPRKAQVDHLPEPFFLQFALYQVINIKSQENQETYQSHYGWNRNVFNIKRNKEIRLFFLAVFIISAEIDQGDVHHSEYYEDKDVT